MNLRKFMFREVSFPFVSIFLFLIGISLFIFGTVCNFIVIQQNEGLMPVISPSDFVFNSTQHIKVENVGDFNYLFLGDIFPFGDCIVSLGDILLFIGFCFVILSFLIICYNSILKLIIRKIRK